MIYLRFLDLALLMGINMHMWKIELTFRLTCWFLERFGIFIDYFSPFSSIFGHGFGFACLERKEGLLGIIDGCMFLHAQCIP